MVTSHGMLSAHVVYAAVSHRYVEIGCHVGVAQFLVCRPRLAEHFAHNVFCPFLVFHDVKCTIKQFGIVALVQLSKFFLSYGDWNTHILFFVGMKL